MRHPRSLLRRLGAVSVALTLVGACGSDDAASPATLADAPTTVAVSAPPPTTRAPRRTTTTLPELPTPLPPPGAGSNEPEVVLGSIEIPAIDLRETMYSGIADTTLDRGPGHWPGTALPGGWGNTVVAGHRVSHGGPFRHLDQLVPGDLIVYETAEGRFEYAVTGTEIVTPDALWITDQTYEQRTTLFACHPPGSVSERIVVSGELVSAEPVDDDARG